MFKIKEETLNNVLNYLATRPYMDVMKLITEIQQVEAIEEEVKVEEKKKK